MRWYGYQNYLWKNHRSMSWSTRYVALTNNINGSPNCMQIRNFKSYMHLHNTLKQFNNNNSSNLKEWQLYGFCSGSVLAELKVLNYIFVLHVVTTLLYVFRTHPSLRKLKQHFWNLEFISSKLSAKSDCFECFN